MTETQDAELSHQKGFYSFGSDLALLESSSKPVVSFVSVLHHVSAVFGLLLQKDKENIRFRLLFPQHNVANFIVHGLL